MPIIKSAKKALRSSERKRVFNLRRQKAAKDLEKKVLNHVKKGEVKEAEALLSKAYKALDKATKMNTLKKGTASRKKSRLSRAIKKVKGK
jgi:small subunit ribosomal protein S20